MGNCEGYWTRVYARAAELLKAHPDWTPAACYKQARNIVDSQSDPYEVAWWADLGVLVAGGALTNIGPVS